MSANVETMFYVREVPWHGLGVRVEDALTSADALHVAGLDWEVKPFPIMNSLDNARIPGMFANTRMTDNRVLGITSEKYKILQNVDAFSFTDALLGGEENVRYETAGSLANGKQVWMLAKMPDCEIAGDAFENYICFTNSHDGKGAVRIVCTPVRVVCQNTLNLAIRGAKRSWTTKHMGDMSMKMEEAHRTLELNSVYMGKLKLVAEKMVMDKINMNEFEKFINNLLPAKEGSDRQNKNIIDMRDELRDRYMNAPDLANLRGTTWGAIQAVSDFATHRAPLRATATYKERTFAQILNGNDLIDTAFALLAA